MSTVPVSPFEKHAGPVIDTLVERFGPRHGDAVLRDYSTLFLGVNTCGAGVHPDDLQGLMGHLTFIAESVTTTLETLTDEPQENIDDEFITIEDLETREGLLRDEELGLALLGAFKYIWPNGRATVLS